VHHHFDVRDEDRLAYDEHGVAVVHAGPDAAVAFARIMPGQIGMQGLAGPDCEDNALVLSGTLSYPTSEKNEIFVTRGCWVVARPGEVFGYWNKTPKPVTLFCFRPKGRGGGPPGAGPRVFSSESQATLPRLAPPSPRTTAYETPSSRGEKLTLHPGERVECPAILCRAALVTDGRVMALLAKSKISLDSGEGLAVCRESVEFIGVGGLSRVAVFSTAL
jgi:hypothetical protein